MSLKIRHVDYKNGTALVQNSKHTFPVTVAKSIRYLICIGDLAKVTKSPVSGEWIMTDYIAMYGRN